MKKKVKRRSLKEIFADMDRVNKRKPTKAQLIELANVLRKTFVKN